MKILRKAFRLVADTVSQAMGHQKPTDREVQRPPGLITVLTHQPLRNDAYRAIVFRDVEQLDEALRKLHPAEVDGRMIELAINQGDVAILRQLLAITGPNEPIVHYKYCASYVFPKRTYSPLEYALAMHRHDIAMALATDPRTDLATAFKSNKDPSAEATKAGMPDVAQVLSKRMGRQPGAFPAPKSAL